MKNPFVRALFSSCASILPVIVIVLILTWTGLIQSTPEGVSTSNFYILLIFGGFLLILGSAIFSIGANRGLSKVGEYMGASLSKQSSLLVVVIFTFLLGTLITIAEPSILIMATQISIPAWILVGAIALGVGIFVVIGILRIIFNGKLKFWYAFLYLITFMLIALVDNGQFLPFIFDSGGVTTGAATVPFILSLGAGVAVVRGGRKSGDNSFGLVGIASIGPIITMTLLIIFYKQGFNPYNPNLPDSSLNAWSEFANALLFKDATHMGSLVEVSMALAPILIVFVVYELIFIKLPRKEMNKLLIGFLYSFIGLVLFLTAANAAMTPIGKIVGWSLGTKFGVDFNWAIILIAFGLGVVTILCEPAVHVLTTQIEETSDGRIRSRTVLLTLAIGVGFAIALSVIRTIYNFSILYYIIPGYGISFILMLICPDVYSAIAFDSGGTASGPMSVSFIFPFIVGLTAARYGESADYYNLSFGVVAMIALTPIIAIQVLGVRETIKGRMRLRVMRNIKHDPSNSEIIHF